MFLKSLVEKIFYGLKFVRKSISVGFWSPLASLSRHFASLAHKRLMSAEWRFCPPEFFDHNIDLYYQWGQKNKSYWLERGIYNLLAIGIFDKPKVVELCCGDGFNVKYFYSAVANEIYACDLDKSAIKYAKKHYRLTNVHWNLKDIRYDLTETLNQVFTNGVTEISNVIWDTAMAYFTLDEIDNILQRISGVLSARQGILSGHTVVKKNGDGKQHPSHRYEFSSKEDLYQLLLRYFKHVIVFETKYEDIHNLYFYAGDGVLPFSPNWRNGIYSDE